MGGLEVGYGYALMMIHVYFNNNIVNYLDDACFMHIIVYRCKPNTWLN
jgi:hypothetical protein